MVAGDDVMPHIHKSLITETHTAVAPKVSTTAKETTPAAEPQQSQAYKVDWKVHE